MYHSGNSYNGFWTAKKGIRLLPLGNDGASGIGITNWSYNNVNVGTSSIGRQLVIAIYTIGLTTFNTSSVKINGNNMTAVVEVNSSDGNRVKTSIFRLPWTGASTINLDINTSANTLGNWYQMYSLTGHTQDAATNTSADQSGDPLSFNLTVPTRGVALAVAGKNNGSTGVWSGLTEDGNNTSILCSAASGYFATGGSIAVSWNHDGTGNESMAGASWN
jgi:hypothetical protein